MVIVKLIVMGVGVKDFDITSNPTVSGLIAKAKSDPEFCRVNFESLDICVNGDQVGSMVELDDDDRITVTTKVKGNSDGFEVQIVRIGSSSGIVRLPAQAGMSVREVLAQINSSQKSEFYKADGSPIYEYRLQDTGKIIDENYVLSYPQNGVTRILMSVKTKGN